MRKSRKAVLLMALVGIGGCAAEVSGSASVSGSAGSSGGASYTPPPPPPPPPAEEPPPPPPPVVEEPPPPPPPPPPPAAQDPIRCSGQEVVELTNVAITSAATTAIQATGQCRVTITTCTITGTRVAVSVNGNAEVTLRDCAVTGATAIQARGNGAVRMTGGSLTGSVQRVGRAVVERDGAPYTP